MGERRGGGGGSQSGEQVNGRSPSGPGSGSRGRARPLARPEAAWARAGSAARLPLRAGSGLAPEVAGTGSRRRDPPRAGTEPR